MRNQLQPTLFGAGFRLPSLNVCKPFVVLLVCWLAHGTVFAACTGSEQVAFADKPVVTVDASTPLRRMEPHFFGFNFIWVEFQDSLWNDAAGKVEAGAVKWLRELPGAVYRYPGGTESNYFHWKAAVGPLDSREPRKAVKWKGPIVTRFGLQEYLAFLREVGGAPWYIVNLYGEYGKEGDPIKLAEAAGQLAEYLKNNSAPGEVMLRWELGNELDRGEYLWSEDKYLAVARKVAAAIRQADPQARFVAIMEDYDAHWRGRRTSASEYNRKVAAGMADLTAEYAQHSYYDGVHIEVPFSVANRIAQVCGNIGNAESVMPNPGKVRVWVTEHTRQPVKSAKDAEWKPTWRKTGNLEVALGLADFMIAAAQIPEVMGVFAHALHGLDVPWPMFHKSSMTSQVHPSVPFWALWVLRQGMESEMMRTVTRSANAGGYFGGYDFRASVMTNSERTKWSAWAVNRSPGAQAVELRIPALAGKKAKASLLVLADDNLDANNYADGNRLRPRALPGQILEFDKAGRTVLTLPPQSITAARFAVF